MQKMCKRIERKIKTNRKQVQKYKKARRQIYVMLRIEVKKKKMSTSKHSKYDKLKEK